jgi:hypothetical protein
MPGDHPPHRLVRRAADHSGGMVESSTILAQQAAAAGVKVVVNTESAATYFTPAGGFTIRPFGYEVDQPVGSLLAAYRSEYTVGNPYPDTHWAASLAARPPRDDPGFEPDPVVAQTARTLRSAATRTPAS